MRRIPWFVNVIDFYGPPCERKCRRMHEKKIYFSDMTQEERDEVVVGTANVDEGDDNNTDENVRPRHDLDSSNGGGEWKWLILKSD